MGRECPARYHAPDQCREPAMNSTIDDAKSITIAEAEQIVTQRVDGGVLVFEPTTEQRDHLDHDVVVSRRLIGVADVDDRQALRRSLAKRGHGVGGAHALEEFEAWELTE